MDSVERDQRKKDKFSERGEKLYKRKTKDDHKKEKDKKNSIRRNVKEING